MSYIKVLHCSLCLNNGLVRFSTKSAILKIQSNAIINQISRLSTTCYWRNKPLLTPQTSANVIKKTKSVPQDNRIWKETPSNERHKNVLQYCLMLSKFRLTSLVVMTSMAGYALAPAPFEATTFLLCGAGTALVSAAANSINQFYEVPFDAQMSRTKNRVLVKGLLEPIHAVGFAAVTSSVGLGLLYFGVNPITAALGAANLILYTSVYTPMKRMSILNTWLGSVVGAIPPIMGWVGCTGAIDAGALVLATLLYSWQFPHFNALSWNLRPDYSRAGYRMMAVTDPALCRRVALRHTGVITAICLSAPYLDVTNMWFALESLPLNLYFMYLAYEFYKKSDSGSSRKLFRFSLLHLPLLMLLMLVNKKYWSSSEDTQIVRHEPARAHDPVRITVLPRGALVAAQQHD